MVCCNFTTYTRHSASNPDVRSEAGDKHSQIYALVFMFHPTDWSRVDPAMTLLSFNLECFVLFLLK